MLIFIKLFEVRLLHHLPRQLHHPRQPHHLTQSFQYPFQRRHLWHCTLLILDFVHLKWPLLVLDIWSRSCWNPFFSSSHSKGSRCSRFTCKFLVKLALILSSAVKELFRLIESRIWEATTTELKFPKENVLFAWMAPPCFLEPFCFPFFLFDVNAFCAYRGNLFFMLICTFVSLLDTD